MTNKEILLLLVADTVMGLCTYNKFLDKGKVSAWMEVLGKSQVVLEHERPTWHYKTDGRIVHHQFPTTAPAIPNDKFGIEWFITPIVFHIN